jgi:hypothetical protein
VRDMGSHHTVAKRVAGMRRGVHAADAPLLTYDAGKPRSLKYSELKSAKEESGKLT